MTHAARPSLRVLVALGLSALLLYGLWLGARDLWNPNEPLYAEAVAEMDARGDWLVPTVNGRTFDEKPILYYWMALLAARIFGRVDELTLRIPSVLSGVAMVLLTYWLVLPYTCRRRAGFATAIVGTLYIVFWSARQVQMDLLVAACTLGAVLAVSRVLDHGARPGPGWAWAGAATALGFLAKGPVGVLCPGLVMFLYIATGRRWDALRTPALLLGAAVFLVVAAPWYLMLLAGGEVAFLQELLFRQNVERFVDPWDHQAPWWYYLKYLWLDMLPWSPLLLLAVGLAPTGDGERRLHRLAWIWLISLVFFFSLSASKRSPYILPAAPALAILVSAVVDRWWSGGLDRPRLIGCRIIVAVTGLLLFPAAWILADKAREYAVEDPELGRLGMAAAWLILVGGVAVLGGLLVKRRQRFASAAALFAFLIVFYLFGSGFVLPAVDPYKSPRVVSDAIRRHVPPDRPLRGFHEWEWRASYSFYAGRPIPPLESVDELRDYWASPEEVFVVVEEGLIDQARGVLGPIPSLESHAVGNNAAHLFSNRERAASAQGDGQPTDP